jgi:hypothetical protein
MQQVPALQDRLIFTPPVESKFPRRGDADHAVGDWRRNWQGGSFDPETKMFYISNTSPTPLGLVPANPQRTDFDVAGHSS